MDLTGYERAKFDLSDLLQTTETASTRGLAHVARRRNVNFVAGQSSGATVRLRRKGGRFIGEAGDE